MEKSIENNFDILQNNINGKLMLLEKKSKNNLDFIENDFILGEMIINYGKLEKYKKEEKKLISGIKKELNIDNYIN